MLQEMTMAKNRYDVGEKYPVVRVAYTEGGGSIVKYLGNFEPWHHKLHEISVVMLTCEHCEMVPREGPNGARGAGLWPGYVFTDGSGNKWHNQYPVAYFSSSGGYKEDFTLVNTAEKDIFQNQYTDYRALLSGVKSAAVAFQKDTPHFAKLIDAHLKELVTAVEKASGLRVVIVPFVFLPDNGYNPEPDIVPHVISKNHFYSRLVDAETFERRWFTLTRKSEREWSITIMRSELDRPVINRSVDFVLKNLASSLSPPFSTSTTYNFSEKDRLTWARALLFQHVWRERTVTFGEAVPCA
jgi:hypothetical protein